MTDNAPSQEFRPSDVNQARRKGLFWLLINLIIIISLIVVLSQSEWGAAQLLPVLREAQFIWLIGGWVCMNLAIFVLGYRWRALLPSEVNVSGSFLGVALSAALLLNYAIPGPFGELVAAWFVSQRGRVGVTQALVAGTTARLLGLLSAAVVAVGLWPFVSLELPPGYAPLFQGLVLCMAACCVVLAALIILPKRFLAYVQNDAPSKGRKLVIDILTSLMTSANLGIGSYIRALIWSLTGHLLAGIGVYCVLYAIYGDLDIVGVAFSYLTMTCSSAFAFLVPGSQWPWDAVMATLLGSTTKLLTFEAVAGAVVLRIAQLAMMGVGVIALQVLMRLHFRSSVER